jgi:hypothetical protein
MFPRTNNRKAISEVLATIIILVASIVLGTGVVVYSTSLFQSGGQQQSVAVTGIQYWVNGTWTASSTGTGGPAGTTIGWGAFIVKNTGDKLLAINSITIRGQAVPFSNWYADTDPTRVAQNSQAQLNYTKNDINGNLKGSYASNFVSLNPILGVANAACPSGQQAQPFGNPYPAIIIQESRSPALISPLCLVQQSGPIGLTAGTSAIIYFKLPNNLAGPTDAGVTSTVAVLAGNAPVAQTVRIATAP